MRRWPPGTIGIVHRVFVSHLPSVFPSPVNETLNSHAWPSSMVNGCLLLCRLSGAKSPSTLFLRGSLPRTRTRFLAADLHLPPVPRAGCERKCRHVRKPQQDVVGLRGYEDRRHESSH